MAAAESWTEPEHWAAVGSVNAWIDLDTRFNSGQRNEVNLTVAGRKQQTFYNRTLVFSGDLPEVDLEAFCALNPADQARHREQALQELQLVLRWQRKLNARSSGLRKGPWNDGQTEVDELGAILEDLRNATGVDPSNPYPWHLLGWFCAQVGDLDRSELALEKAAAALARVPADEMGDMRRRLALDRAWNMRNLGKTQLALDRLRVAEEAGGPDFESNLLRGLIAAVEGDMTVASHFAGLVQTLGNYGQEFGRRMDPRRRQSLVKYGPQLAASWILALTWLEMGYPEEAAAAYPDWGLRKRRLPLAPIPHLYWRDAGYIYYRIGSTDLAILAWERGLHYTPFRPFFVFQSYAADVRDVPGMSGELPFFLNFGLFPAAGSRFGYAVSLTRSLGPAEASPGDEALLSRIQAELFICLRNKEFRPQSYLALEHAYRRTGHETDAVGCRALAVKAFTHQGYVVADQTPGQAIALGDRQPKSLVRKFILGPEGESQTAWPENRPVQAVLAEIQATYFAERTPENRRRLARFLIRNLQVADGRRLLIEGQGSDPGAGRDLEAMPDEDLVILLEADRQEGVDVNARHLMATLTAGFGTPRANSEIWALSGAILLDQGDRVAGVKALRRAVALDPENGGLQMQLRLVSD